MTTNNMSVSTVDDQLLLDTARFVVDTFWRSFQLSTTNGKRRRKKPANKQNVINNSFRHLGLDATYAKKNHIVKSPRNRTKHDATPSPRPGGINSVSSSTSYKRIQAPNKKVKSPRKISASKLRKRPVKLRQVRPLSAPGLSNIDWPLAINFELDDGKTKIIEFIEKTWEYDSNLNYIVEHVYTAQLTNARRYKYRVCWYWPDLRRRASMSTASVYFNIDVPYDEMHRRVEVTYTFQRDKLLHRPGRSRFHQKWLSDLIEGHFLVAQVASA